MPRAVTVLIAGGGPVGMTLALELARLGVASMLVECNASTTRHPKMDITNARSMEIFRRLGIAGALREVAVPEENNFDVAWITSLTGHELHRFRYPSVIEWRRLIEQQNDGSLPGEPPMRVSQVEIEPRLQRAVLAAPLIEGRWGVTFEEFDEDARGITAKLRTPDGQRELVACRFLVGCDGGASRVRSCMDIGLEGRARVAERFMTHFRSDARSVLQRFGIAWHYQSPAGTLIAQNDHDIWTLQTRWPDGVTPHSIDPDRLVRAFAGTSFGFDVLVANAWTPHLLVARSYGGPRVFLAGDAAHQYIPTGGYGMNTGIGDACDLGWKLAAVLRGFGGPALLASYHAERHPIGVRNREASARHADVRHEIARVYHDGLFADGPSGDRARAEAGRRIALIGNAENESFGVELGYAYATSPIICRDPGAQIPDDPVHYVPTTVPGVRVPSVILSDGQAIHDRLGPWFTLLCLGVPASKALIEAAADCGVPLRVVVLDEAVVRRVYGPVLLLVRPDQHVAWRGRACEDRGKAHDVVRTCLGWG